MMDLPIYICAKIHYRYVKFELKHGKNIFADNILVPTYLINYI